MFTLFLSGGILKWAVLPTFWRNIQSPSSDLKQLGEKVVGFCGPSGPWEVEEAGSI